MSEPLRLDLEVRRVWDGPARLGEGPVWSAREQALYWVDIKTPRVHRLDPATGAVRSWTPPLRIGSLAPRAAGGFVAGAERGLGLVDAEFSRFDLLVDPEADRPGNRFNDGKLDGAGRFWAGTMDDAEQAATGALYRLDPDGGCTRMDDGYAVTNGPAFSPDGRWAYHTDSALRVIHRFELGADGALGAKRVFARFHQADGHPDGMTVDAEGALWVAFWDGWCVRRLSPEGETLAVLDLPVQRPTSCAFGGPELDRLYVTSATVGLDPAALAAQPHAGALFEVRPGVRGVSPPPFAG